MQNILEKEIYNFQNVIINKKNYRVKPNEFMKINHYEYNNLSILKDLGEYERIVSLFYQIFLLLEFKPNAIFTGISHGGYTVLESLDFFNSINCFFNDILDIENLKFNSNNLKEVDLSKIFYTDFNFDKKYEFIFVDKETEYNKDLIDLIHKFQPILVTKQSLYFYQHFDSSNYFIYELSNSSFLVCIPKKYQKELNNSILSKYIKNNTLFYDNLLELVMIVKNGGNLFKEMLIKNYSQFDYWTILDTGSTDNTIEIINEVLKNKPGKLYQEPFVDFKVSRNRSLDLASNHCKFNLVLDDTYILKGNLRNFLNEVRGDQFSDSFDLYVSSDDNQYISNRITKSKNKLRYIFRIHEVISPVNNTNVCIPFSKASIFDLRSDDMEKRTLSRKEFDLSLLFKDLEEIPENPRTLYYIAQTYSCINNYEKAYEYFIKRIEHPVEGLLQEKVDACFEAARLSNFRLNKSWENSKKLYEKAYNMDPRRPESLYFLGIHYYLEKEDDIAFGYFKNAFEIGYPIELQYSLKPTLSFHFVPKFLAELCYKMSNKERNHFKLGEKVCDYFLENNSNKADSYDLMVSWINIFKHLNLKSKSSKFSFSPSNFIFIAPGGFSKWTDKNEALGGSERYIVEMAKYIKNHTNYNVYVFCNCDENESENYLPLSKLYTFLSNNDVDHCLISRYNEYIPLCIFSNIKNIYYTIHDLSPSNLIIPMNEKLKKIFCMTEWHKNYFLKNFSNSKNITTFLSNGVDLELYKTNQNKVPFRFIYSSFPNRGLLQVLKVWKDIKSRYPSSSLHIYCDLENNTPNGRWVNTNFSQMMNEIRNLIEELKDLDITNYGFVSQKELANAWKEAEIWFYPTDFLETCCITAIESAASKTLVVANIIGGLENTVGDRGINYQNNLENLFSILDNDQKKKELVEKNYQWSLTYDWKDIGKNFLEIIN